MNFSGTAVGRAATIHTTPSPVVPGARALKGVGAPVGTAVGRAAVVHPQPSPATPGASAVKGSQARVGVAAGRAVVGPASLSPKLPHVAPHALKGGGAPAGTSSGGTAISSASGRKSQVNLHPPTADGPSIPTAKLTQKFSKRGKVAAFVSGDSVSGGKAAIGVICVGGRVDEMEGGEATSVRPSKARQRRERRRKAKEEGIKAAEQTGIVSDMGEASEAEKTYVGH